MDIEQFLEGRDMGDVKATLLRYACTVADKYEIEVRPRGRSLVRLHFDCGAYKGEEIITFNLSTITPMRLAVALEKLTSGHIFRFKEADEVLLAVFNSRIKQPTGGQR